MALSPDTATPTATRGYRDAGLSLDSGLRGRLVAMSVTVHRTVRRWLVPSAAALAVIAGGVAIGLVTNAADSAPPPRTAQELLAGLQTAQVAGLQGTVTLRADLGLPPLPVPSLGSADLGSLVSGTHTLRVWYANPGQARVALLGRDGETDIIVNGDEAWLWSSKKQEAMHGRLPTGPLPGLLAGPGRPGNAPATPIPAAPGDLLDPETMARLALTLLEQLGTDVTTDSGARVAGRSAYELTIAPKDPRSLIKSIVIAIDADTNLPLRLAVNARDGGAPAFEVAFTELSLTQPDPARFEFSPPPGTTVVEAEDLDLPLPLSPALPGLPGLPGLPEVVPSADLEPGSGRFADLGPGSDRFATVGTGWTMVLAARIPDHGGDDRSGELTDPLPRVSGDWGSGHLLKTRLFSVLLTDDGRVLAGAVGPDLLYAAAADPATQFGS